MNGRQDRVVHTLTGSRRVASIIGRAILEALYVLIMYAWTIPFVVLVYFALLIVAK
jgi:hypothetical protein